MIGQTVSHYKILEELGKGGMGVVYKAEDTKLHRTVALKFIAPSALSDVEQKTRLIKEARAVASLNHPHINTVYEIDEVEDSTFIAMEYVDGLSLKQMLKPGPLQLDSILDIASQVAEGLQEAHEKGVIHRDIKSSNIMVTAKGQVKIMDFGLAKFSGDEDVTRTAGILGTAAYMSPEQASNESLDQQTDIWSFGVVLYEMLSAQLPFQGGMDHMVLYAIVNNDPIPIGRLRPDIPLELENIIEKCLQKDRKKRYLTSYDLKADLDRVKSDLITGRISPYPKRSIRYFLAHKRVPRLAVPVAIGLILILLILIIPSLRETITVRLGLRPIPPKQYLAILPFNYIGDNPDIQRMCQGLVELMTNKLTQLEGVQGTMQVVPSSDVYALDLTSTIGARESLGVNLVITGTLVDLEDKYILTLNLADSENQVQLRAKDVEAPIESFSILYDHALDTVIEMLALETLPGLQEVLTAGRTQDQEAEALYMQGRGLLLAYSDLDSINNAIQFFQRSIDRDPNYALAIAGLSEAFWAKWLLTKEPEWMEQAKIKSSQALAINDNLSDVLAAAANVYRGTGELDKASATLRRAMDLDPANYEVHLGMGEVLFSQGKTEEAEKEYSRAIELKPDYWGGYSSLGVFYLYQARYEDAEKMFVRVTELTPNNERGFTLLGIVYDRLEQPELAIQNYLRSIEIKPTATAYSNLGTLYFFQKNYQLARDMFKSAIDLGRNVSTIRGNLADTLRFTGDMGGARESYQEAIRLGKRELEVSPTLAHVYAQMGRYYAILGEKQSALENIRQSLKLEPKNVEVLRTCVKAYELMGERGQALTVLNTLIKLGGNLDEIFQNPDLEELRKDERYKRLIQQE